MKEARGGVYMYVLTMVVTRMFGNQTRVDKRGYLENQMTSDGASAFHIHCWAIQDRHSSVVGCMQTTEECVLRFLMVEQVSLSRPARWLWSSKAGLSTSNWIQPMAINIYLYPPFSAPSSVKVHKWERISTPNAGTLNCTHFKLLSSRRHLKPASPIHNVYTSMYLTVLHTGLLFSQRCWTNQRLFNITLNPFLKNSSSSLFS